MKWDLMIFNNPENPTSPVIFKIKHILYWRGRRIDLHKMVNADRAGCYHTHPAYAIRWIVWGGYVEELEDGTKKTWMPGMGGLVRPELSHRIDKLLNGRSSYSLWFRGRVFRDILLRGPGWSNAEKERVTPPEGYEASA